MTPYDPKLFDLILKKYKDRFLLVIYRHGYAGHLVSRIIKSSSQYYCNEDDPLRFPDSTEGFPAFSDLRLDFKTQHLACVQQDDTVIWPWSTQEDKMYHENYMNYLTILKNTDYHLNIVTHNFDVEEKYPEVKRIRIFGNLNDSYRALRIIHPEFKFFKVNKKPFFPLVKPSNNKSVYNLNINKLLSEDYEEFEDEYLKLTWAFDLECKINSVRSFILLWLEKQKRLIKYS